MIRRDQKYQRSFRDQQIRHKQIYLHLGISLLTQLDGEVYRKLNSVAESQITGNICISQKCHTSITHQLFQDFV